MSLSKEAQDVLKEITEETDFGPPIDDVQQ